MCINPNFVWVERGPKWEQQPVACRQCWRCKQNRVNDYVARAMCEASVSQISCTITLSYAPRDDLADKVLHPRHFQLFMKLLRRAGHKVRYLVAGEYGDLKGRAHFHAILFFTHLEPLGDRGLMPRYKDDYAPGTSAEDWGPFCREIPHKRMIHIREWPHGHIKVDWSASEESARYVCKYLLAENKNNAWFSLSKKPALGAAWFAKKAEKARELGVLPSTFEYMPPGGTKGRPYLMTGATRRDYLNAITTDPAMRERMSEWVRKSFDKYERQRVMADLEGQPIEVLDAIFNERVNLTEFFQKLHRIHADRRLTAHYKHLMDTYGEMLLKHGNKYLPRSHVLNMRERDNGT